MACHSRPWSPSPTRRGWGRNMRYPFVSSFQGEAARGVRDPRPAGPRGHPSPPSLIASEAGRPRITLFDQPAPRVSRGAGLFECARFRSRQCQAREASADCFENYRTRGLTRGPQAVPSGVAPPADVAKASSGLACRIGTALKVGSHLMFGSDSVRVPQRESADRCSALVRWMWVRDSTFFPRNTPP